MSRSEHAPLPARPGGPPLAWLLPLIGATAATGWLAFWAAVPCVAVAHAAYLVLARRVVRAAWAPTFGQALLIAALLRAVCLPHAPSWSDDIYRYLHEGAVVLSGENPYLVAPADVDPALRGPYWSRVNNADIPAAYPPGVQYALALAAAITAEPWGVKLLFGVLDLLVFVALWRWLPRIGLPPARACIYGFCPLLAIEFAGQGHSDSLAVLGMVLAVAAAGRARHAASAAWLAVATAGKLLPVVLLLPTQRGAPARGAVGLTVFAVVLLALYAPFAADPGAMLQGTEQYSRRWSGNATLYEPVLAAAQAAERAGWLSGFEAQWLREGQGLAKLPLVLLGLGLLFVGYRRRWPAHDVAFAFFAFFVAFAPTVHPWYVALLVPWLCVYPSLGLLAFLGTVFLAYHVLPAWHRDGVWRESWWIKTIEYAPFYLGLLAFWRRTPDGFGRTRPPRAAVATRHAGA